MSKNSYLHNFSAQVSQRYDLKSQKTDISANSAY